MENNTGYINYMLILKLTEFFKRKKKRTQVTHFQTQALHNKLFPSLLYGMSSNLSKYLSLKANPQTSKNKKIKKRY